MGKMTIQKMAENLGLSRNTVSLALRESEVVAKSTRAQVLEYAKRTGYYKIAEPKKTHGPRYHVMVLRRPNEAEFWDKILRGLMEEARAENCLIQIAVVLEEDIRNGKLPVGCGEGIDAFLFLNIFPKEYIELVLREKKTGIFLDGDVHQAHSKMYGDMIKSEGLHSVQRITEHMIAQGCRRIQFFSSDDVEDCQTICDRLTGYQQAMEAAELPMTTLKELARWKDTDVYSLDGIRKYVDSFEEMPDAFVCSNDVLAQRLTKVLQERGVRVPEDVLVSGFDNNEAASVSPFLTTADFQSAWLGKRLIMQMMWRLAHPQAPYETIVVESEVVFRTSTEGKK